MIFRAARVGLPLVICMGILRPRHVVHGVLGEQSIRQGDERDGASQQLVSTHGGRAPCRVDTGVHLALLPPRPAPVRRVLKDPPWMEADLRSQGERRDAAVRGW